MITKTQELQESEELIFKFQFYTEGLGHYCSHCHEEYKILKNQGIVYDYICDCDDDDRAAH